MGYYIRYEELQLVEQSILNQIANWNNQLEELSKKLIDVAGMEEIKGATANSIRDYIYEVHMTLMGSLNQLLKEYETRLILYANGYYELDSDARAEISQDELEEQLTNLKREQENFSDTSNSVSKTLRSISDIIYLSGPPSYGVKSNYNTIHYEVGSLKDKIGEYEESHLKSDFNTIEEMVSTLSQIIKGHMGKEDITITNYKAGTIGEVPTYKTLLDIYGEQEAYLIQSSKDLEKAAINFIERKKIMEEIYVKERIGEGLTQTAGGAVSFFAGAGLILTIATGGLAGPVVFGLAAVGTCSMLYGLSNSAEGGDNLFYGLKGDGTSIAVNPIRDSIFQSNPELYYQIGNTSTILATMGTPIAGGVPVEQVIATQTKRIISGTVGSAVSNALIDRYDMNPYMAMGIGIGISNITYEGINYIGNMDYVNGFGIKPVEAMENVKMNSKVGRLTSDSVKKVINDNGMTVDEFSKLLEPDKILSSDEQKIVNKVRQEIGIPKNGTVMVKVIPQSDIEKYLANEQNKRYKVRGFVSVNGHSKNLKTLESVYEGNRLDYSGSKYKVNCEIDSVYKYFDNPDTIYGKIVYKLENSLDVKIPDEIPTPENYPYTGRGFTGSKNIILPELIQSERQFVRGDILKICDAETGKVVQEFKFSRSIFNPDKLGKWIRIK